MGKVIGTGFEAIKSFVDKCLGAGGVPIFRTKYGGRKLPENSVIAACWGKGAEVPGGTIKDVPADIIEKLEKTRGDWRWIKGGL